MVSTLTKLLSFRLTANRKTGRTRQSKQQAYKVQHEANRGWQNFTVKHPEQKMTMWTNNRVTVWASECACFCPHYFSARTCQTESGLPLLTQQLVSLPG